MEKANLTHGEWVKIYNVLTERSAHLRKILSQLDEIRADIQSTGFATSEHFIFHLFGLSRGDLVSAQETLKSWIETVDSNLEATMRGGKNESRSE